MSDPLSVAASIVGILAASGKLYELIHTFVTTTKDAPQSLVTLDVETRQMRAVLSRLEILLHGLFSASLRRREMVQIDDLIATLTDTVNVYSELDALIVPYLVCEGEKLSFVACAKWTQVEAGCMKVVDRLQRHKASISLMLSIFLW